MTDCKGWPFLNFLEMVFWRGQTSLIGTSTTGNGTLSSSCFTVGAPRWTSARRASQSSSSILSSRPPSTENPMICNSSSSGCLSGASCVSVIGSPHSMQNLAFTGFCRQQSFFRGGSSASSAGADGADGTLVTRAAVSPRTSQWNFSETSMSSSTRQPGPKLIPPATAGMGSPRCAERAAGMRKTGVGFRQKFHLLACHWSWSSN
mmetsp:Transcript_5232/g.8961  ORF Transcript_5232/g.8961 Transcript_5232/m.8961 type:complete len:205 (+) Transcript_5232:212-826(+)